MHRVVKLIVVCLLIAPVSPVFGIEHTLPDTDIARVQIGKQLLEILDDVPDSGTYGTIKDLFVYSSPAPDAYHLPDGRIFLSTALLHDLKNIHEMAFVIAHELAHLELAAAGAHSEEEADLHAIRVLQQRGYETHAALDLLQRFYQSHQYLRRVRPNILARVNKLQIVLQSTTPRQNMALQRPGLRGRISNSFY